MELSGNTILITGGTSGIGLELATQLVALDNMVIVTGRSKSGLDAAKKRLQASTQSKAMRVTRRQSAAFTAMS